MSGAGGGRPGAAGFLGSAKSRLLPASIPFRFFVAAALFHLAFWFWLFVAAEQVPHFAGGGGRVLGAVHILTLGVFATTALGAAFQLLPVATKAPLGSTAAPRIVSWLLLPSVPVFAAGISENVHEATMLGGIGTAAALLLAGGVLAFNLRKPGGMAMVVSHVWAALASLAALVALGLLLAVDQQHGFLGHRAGWASAHAALAIYGFMGMLAAGFSYILLPMFALSPAPPARMVFVAFGLAAAGVAAAAIGAAIANATVETAGIGLGLAGATAHVALSLAILRARMRRQMGPFLLLVRVAWLSLPLSLFVAAGMALRLDIPNAPALFGSLALVGWLLSFVAAMFQRIVPFLASMHATTGGKPPPLVSTLSPPFPLALHRYAHIGALAALLAGVAANEALLIRAGALIGALGALALGWFLATAMSRAFGKMKP